MAKGTLRIDKESGHPILVIVNQLQLYCHHQVEEETEEGTVQLKMRPTSKFINRLNERVLEVLDESIQNARKESRTELREDDVPEFIEV
jgi:hypothetical protein